jgi:drug/metabolite transporter (DMT)-like permease
MVWLILSLSGPTLWALANVLDSGLRKKWIKDEWALTWLAALLRIPVLVVLLLISNPFRAGLVPVALMLLSGLLLSLPYLLYYRALKTEDSSRIAVFVQMIPVFNLLTSALFLHERLTLNQTVAFVILLSAGLMAALRLTGHKLKISSNFFLLLFASFVWSVSDTLFKGTITAFPHYLDGFTLYTLGSELVLFVLIGHALKARPFKLLREMAPVGWTLILGSTFGGLLGTVAFTFALTLGKVSLTSVMMGVQPLAAFAINGILARTTHSIPPEQSDRKNLILKLISFGLVIIGLIALEFG